MPTNAVVSDDKTDDEITLPEAGVSLRLEDLKAQIAAELASGLADADGVQARYGISAAQWDLLRASPVFRKMVAEALRTWGGELNAGQRITKKSEIVLEDAIPVLDEIAHNHSLNPSTRIEAIKQMESLTGRKNKEAGQSAGAGFTLQINIGDGKQGLLIEGTTLSAAVDE